jgi:hypothetical protein
MEGNVNRHIFESANRRTFNLEEGFDGVKQWKKNCPRWLLREISPNPGRRSDAGGFKNGTSFPLQIAVIDWPIRCHNSRSTLNLAIEASSPTSMEKQAISFGFE